MESIAAVSDSCVGQACAPPWPKEIILTTSSSQQTSFYTSNERLHSISTIVRRLGYPKKKWRSFQRPVVSNSYCHASTVFKVLTATIISLHRVQQIHPRCRPIRRLACTAGSISTMFNWIWSHRTEAVRGGKDASGRQPILQVDRKLRCG